MNTWKQLLLGSDQQIGRRNMIWNMIGSAIYALSSMMIGMAVTRILGADLGGIFFFAFTTFGQQMFIVSYFGMRPIQITDVQEEHSFGEYRRFRVYTSALAILTGFFYVLFWVENPLKKMVVILMVCYKVLDGFADVYESEFQRNGKLYLTGKSNTFRTLLSVGSFLLELVLTKDLVGSCVIAVAAQVLGFLLFNQSLIQTLPGIVTAIRPGAVRELWQSGKWLFLSAFLDLYIFSASKYAIDAYMEPSASTYFGTIFIPTSVINLAAGFVIRPFLTTLSEYWEAGAYEKFWKVIQKIACAIAVFTGLGMLAAYLFGIPVLALLLGAGAGRGLMPLKGALLINILGGGFYALLNLLYYVLVIVKDQKSIFVIYGIGCMAAVILSPWFVKNYGIHGGAYSYLLLMMGLTALFVGAALKNYRKVRNAHGSN